MAKSKQISFEDALNALKQTAEKIKSKDITLDESISCYEEGLKHYEKCKEILESTKQMIKTNDLEDYDEGEL